MRVLGWQMKRLLSDQAFVQTVQWRLISLCIDFGIGYLLFGHIVKVTLMTAVLTLVKSTVFYFWRRYKGA